MVACPSAMKSVPSLHVICEKEKWHAGEHERHLPGVRYGWGPSQEEWDEAVQLIAQRRDYKIAAQRIQEHIAASAHFAERPGILSEEMHRWIVLILFNRLER